MKIYVSCLLFVLFSLPLSGSAEGWTPETLPMVHLHNRLQYLCNPDSIISPSTTSYVDAALRKLEDSTGVQSVVVVVKHLEGDDPYTFGMDLAKKYGIGLKSQNSGLIIILATEDRSYRILTGEGLEGALPDAICSRIERQVMVPLLKKGAWDEAIRRTVGAVSGYIQGDKSLVAEAEDNGSEEIGWGAVVFLFLGLGVFVWAFLSSERRDCPRCKGRHTLRKKAAYFDEVRGQRMMHIVWVCKVCGHTEKEDKKPPTDDNYTSPRRGIGPIIFMGGGRGGSSGGGFGGISGGSFGGGSFGGGGAGGRF